MNSNSENATLAPKKLSVTVLGAGAWGTALALLCARNGHNVTLWCFESDVADEITHHRINKCYFPDIILDAPITATTSLSDALHAADLIIEAIPIAYLRSILTQAKPFHQPHHTWIVTSKGIELDTLLFPADIIKDVLKTNNTVVLSGPSFARDIANKQITAIDVSASDTNLAVLQQLFCNNYFSLTQCSDPIGMQVGGALKNVIAIGVGILEGAGYTDNTKALFVTKALQELTGLVKILGGNPQTLYGLSGIGDIIVTAMGTLSKNKLFGKLVGNGLTFDEIKQQMPQLPEGVNTLQSLHEMQKRHAINMPLCTKIYEIVFKDATVAQLIERLLTFDSSLLAGNLPD
jgi:glycerol-3-phosphate dehydrogenase (NAD(P)+)